MSLLTIVQAAARRCGLERPNTALQSTDENILQMTEWANAVCRDLVLQVPWQALQGEASFFTIGGEFQAIINTLAPNGFSSITPDTMYNRTTQDPVFGPATREEWQWLHAHTVTSRYAIWRIRQAGLYLFPAPTVGHQIYFEYNTGNWNTTTGGATFASDDDLPIFDEELIILGVIWQWKKGKGFAFGDAYETYRRRLDDLAANDGGRRSGLMAWDRRPMRRGFVNYPSGSWG